LDSTQVHYFSWHVGYTNKVDTRASLGMDAFGMKQMKVLNIAQPNAHYVIHKGKNVENRTMRTKFRGTIAIYGSKTYSSWRFDDSHKHGVEKDDCAFGAIVGFVDLVDCISARQVKSKTRKWFHGPYGYVLSNVIILKKPIPVKPPGGAIVWWTLKGPKLKACLRQLSSAQRKRIRPAE